MPWVHEDLTTEAGVKKHFPTAVKYAGTDAGFNKFKRHTKWGLYDPYSADNGGAAWRLENAGGPVKMYSKSAGPYSRGRAFTRNALTWFADGMIQMSLPYHSGSHNDHEYMLPNGDDQNHRIRVIIQFWVSVNVKECVRFDLGCFRPVRKWKQGGFCKALLVKTGSELIENINSIIQTTIQTSQKEITDLKKNHDQEIAGKDEKIKVLTEQVASLSTENKKLKGNNKRLRDNLDETKGELDETMAKLHETNARLADEQQTCKKLANGCNEGALRQSKQTVFLLQRKQQRLQKEFTELKKELNEKDEFLSRQSRTLRKHDIPASQLES